MGKKLIAFLLVLVGLLVLLAGIWGGAWLASNTGDAYQFASCATGFIGAFLGAALIGVGIGALD